MQRLLISFGLLASLLYVAIDVFGALSYPAYNYAGQAISEMSALGAPTASLLAPFYAMFSVLFAGFAVGVWLAGEPRSWLRRSAAFLLAVAVLGVGWALFPMNMRGVPRTLSDTMHLVLAVATMLLLSGAIASGAMALGRTFRIYSSMTVIVMLTFFALTMVDVPQVAAGIPTPYMGLNERVSMFAWLLWIALFSLQLLPRSQPGSQKGVHI